VNQPFKLFFDECCSKKLARKIKDIYDECYPKLETKHLSEFCSTGTDDQDWLARLEKDWIVLTADRGRDSRKQKLPTICGRLGITHISMTPVLLNAGYRAQKQALLSCWPEILKTPQLPKGTRVSFGYRAINRGLSLIPWLSIEQQAFVIWCKEKGVKISN